MAAARKTTKKKTPARKTTKKKKSASGGKKTTTSKKKTTTKSRPDGGAKKKTTKAKTVKKTTKTRSSKKTTVKSRGASEGASAKKDAPSKPRARKKPAFDAEFLKTVRESLVDDRRQLMSMLQSTQAELAGRDTGLADLSDMASGGFEDELALGLMASESATLEKIDAAIQRIDDGSYGICVDCEHAIPKKRLEFLPFALRCMDCEGTRERRVRMGTLEA